MVETLPTLLVLVVVNLDRAVNRPMEVAELRPGEQRFAYLVGCLNIQLKHRNERLQRQCVDVRARMTRAPSPTHALATGPSHI